MATLPGMRGDVFFGDSDARLPDWRKGPEETDDDRPPTREERAALVAVLGFDPRDIDDGPTRHSRRRTPDRYAEDAQGHKHAEDGRFTGMGGTPADGRSPELRRHEGRGVEHAAAQLGALYNRATDPSLSYEEIESAVHGMAKQFDAAGLRAVAKAFGIRSGLGSKGATARRIIDYISERKGRHERGEVIGEVAKSRKQRRGLPRRHASYDGTWVTIGGQPGPGGQQHAGGHAVLIDGRGRIIGGNVPRSMHGTPVHEFANTIRAQTGRQGTPREPNNGASNRAGAERGGSESDTAGPAAAGRPVASPPGGAGDSGAGAGGAGAGQPAGATAAQRLPAPIHEVNRKLDRYAQFFRAKGQGEVADWMGRLKEHVAEVGVEEALAALGAEKPAEGLPGETQYEGKADDMSAFCEAYLNRVGIAPATSFDPSKRLVSSQSPQFAPQARPDPFYAGDFAPRDPTFKDKLQEAKHLPGLESSEDINTLCGKQVTHLTPEVTAKLDATYGKGQWIVKTYGDEAFAGRGIFFPQRAEQIKRDAQNAIWTAGENLAKYGFRVGRDPDTGRAFGLVHESGDIYQFGTAEYESTIQGDARHWAGVAEAAAANEAGPELPFGGKQFMAQPAFPVVGISDADRAAGMTIKPGQEGRVHIVTRNGRAEVIPHSTWLKQNDLPVVFESKDTLEMAKAAQDAIDALPASERQGQIYAPDIVKTDDGYKVVEANPANETGSSGYLGDNPFIIDAYVSHLTGREPAHVAFIRRLLTVQHRRELRAIRRGESMGGSDQEHG